MMRKTTFTAIVTTIFILAACGGGDDEQASNSPNAPSQSIPTINGCQMVSGNQLPTSPFTGALWAMQSTSFANSAANKLVLAIAPQGGYQQPQYQTFPQMAPQSNVSIAASGEITISLGAFYQLPQGMTAPIVRACVSSSVQGYQTNGYIDQASGSIQRLVVSGPIDVPAWLAGPQQPNYYQQSNSGSVRKNIELTLGGNCPTRAIQGKILGCVEARLTTPYDSNNPYGYGQTGNGQAVQFQAQ